MECIDCKICPKCAPEYKSIKENFDDLFERNELKREVLVRIREFLDYLDEDANFRIQESLAKVDDHAERYAAGQQNAVRRIRKLLAGEADAEDTNE